MGIDGFDCEVIDGKIARVTAFLTRKKPSKPLGCRSSCFGRKSGAVHGKQH